MKSVDFEGIIEKAYSILKPHEEWWLADNDYRYKYRYVKEAVEERPNYTKDTVEYIAKPETTPTTETLRPWR